jgi:hypothetical protein
MKAWATVRILALGGIVSAGVLVGCTLQDGTPSVSSGGGGYGGSSSGSASGTSSSSGGSTSTQPMLVVVDPNRTMNATPGDGVGVFTQYVTGGHWNIWWTCDTNKTSLPCAFDVTVTVSTGTIANAAGQTLGSTDTLTQSSTQDIEVVTTTTTGIQGVTFDTVVPPGTTPIITLNAELGGMAAPQYLFFVQDGEINGNYQGMLTDPLMLEPSSP